MRAPLRVLASSCLALASVGCGRSESTSTPASFRQRPPSSAASPVGRYEDILKEMRSGPGAYDSIEVVKDQRVCEAGAARYARYRTMDLTQTAPRLMVPVLVVRVGGVWLVDDLRDPDIDSESGVFSRS